VDHGLVVAGAGGDAVDSGAIAGGVGLHGRSVLAHRYTEKYQI
jgi:hypothetical protein